MEINNYNNNYYYYIIIFVIISDLAKRVEEEATGGEDGEAALDPEAQFSLDSLDIIKVAYQKSSF